MSTGQGGGRVEFRILGPFEAACGDRVLEIGSIKQRILLCMLVLRLNEVVDLDAIVEGIWRDEPPASARHTVQTLVSRLRLTLVNTSVRARAPGYVLEADPDQVDARRFERRAAAGREAMTAGDPEGAADAFEDALRLWRGPALADLADEPFARLEAGRLDEARMTVIEELAEAELARGRPENALGIIDPHVGAHPLRERGWGALMVALYRLGRQADALRAYQSLRRLLGEELGVEPSPWLRRLEQQILCHAPELEKASQPTTSMARGAPMETRAMVAGNLPVALTSFVGRATELEELGRALLAGTRLITLRGVGGIGKTRLAMEAAVRAGGQFPHGVWLVELGALRDADLVAAEAVASLGLQFGGLLPPAELIERLGDHLADRNLLLVLDNCEHLLDAAAKLARSLLQRCPGIRVLATSRESLGIPGEVPWDLLPMTLPPDRPRDAGALGGSDAAKLFCARAADARLTFNLTDANACAVARICRRLDGIPLALELAAAWIRLLSAEQIAQHLDDCFALLTGGGRSEVTRQRTLWATMDWSHQLLSPSERLGFRRLSVFPGTFELASAEGVVAMPESERVGKGSTDVLEVVSRLVERSLLAVQSDDPSGRRDSAEVRYRMLETVRQYAGERLASAGETAEAKRRHRDFFLDLARPHAGTHDGWDTASWPRRLAADEDNFRAAITWSLEANETEAALTFAASMWRYWHLNSRQEGIGWLERALAEPGRDPSSSARIEALCGLGGLLTFNRKCDRARALGFLEEAVRLGRAVGDVQGVARAHLFLGNLSLAEGDMAKARKFLDLAHQGFEGTSGVAWCDFLLAAVAMDEGDERRARARCEHAAAWAGRGEVLGAHALAALAPFVARSGEAERALALCEEALRRSRQLPMRLIEAMALTRAAETRLLLGDQQAATETVGDLLLLLSDLGTHAWVADALELSAVLLAEHKPRAAAVIFRACDELRGARAERGFRPIADRVSEARTRIPSQLASDARIGPTLSVAEALAFATAELGRAPAKLH